MGEIVFQSFEKHFKLEGISFQKFDDIIDALYSSLKEFGRIDEYFKKTDSRYSEDNQHTVIFLLEEHVQQSAIYFQEKYDISHITFCDELHKLVHDKWFGDEIAPWLTKERDEDFLKSLEKTLKKTKDALWAYWDCRSSDQSLEWLPGDPKELANQIGDSHELVSHALGMLKDKHSKSPSKFFHRHQFVATVYEECRKSGQLSEEICLDIHSLLEPLGVFADSEGDPVERINSDRQQFKKHKLTRRKPTSK